MKMIEISNLSFRFSLEAPFLFKNLSFNIDKEDRVYISGENGSGKTTLLKLLIGVLISKNGSVNYTKSNWKKIFIPPKVDNFLLPWYSVKQNFNFFNNSGDNINSKINDDEYLKSIKYFFPNVSEKFLIKRIYELSSGEKAVISFISSQLTNPDIYFLDEIFANTSSNISNKIINYITDKKQTVVFTSHSRNIAKKLCTKEIEI